ncbi:MAG TPA: LppX_LprAFG lipoprotein [Gemmatimonadales bacterium]|nr:LppX_LprAFG lipoprotein [Gemmatimonadales bacterium]
MPPETGAILEAAIAAMSGVDTVAFSMERSGAPVEIEDLEFASAEGRYAAPDSADALLSMRAGDLTVRLGTIAVGERVWLTNPLTGAWEQLDPGTGFNPAIVFDPRLGWVPLLGEDLSDPVYVGTEEVGGVEAHHLSGRIAARRIEALTGGLVEPQDVAADLWFDAVSGRIAAMSFTTRGPGGDTHWRIDLSEYGAPVDIRPPG